jgi:hypothetical protein
MFAVPTIGQDHAGFHLSFQAAGYKDAEHSTPRIDAQVDFKDIEVKLKKTPGQAGAKSYGLCGRVTRGGKPVARGWIALTRAGSGTPNAPNADIMRGRTTTSPMSIVDEGAIRDGEYTLHAGGPAKRYALLIYEPGQAPTLVGNVSIDEKEMSSLDVACVPGGDLEGRVPQVPNAMHGQLWAVAFSRAGYRAETRVQHDGSFRFTNLPPGEYGVKVGLEGIMDREVRWAGEGKGADYKPTKEEIEAFQKAFEVPADPWKRARLATVRARETVQIAVELPEELK